MRALQHIFGAFTRRERVIKRALVSSFLATFVGLFLFSSSVAANSSGTNSIAGNGTGGLSPRSQPCDTWSLNGVSAGTTVTITLWKGTMSDPYLHIFDGSGSQVTQDDDSAGNLNSRVSVRWESGYYVGASVFSSNNGSYSLQASAGSSWTRISSSCRGAPVKQNQTITFTNPGTRTFGSSFALSASATSNLTVSFSTSTPSICTLSGSTVNLVAAGSCTVTASQAGNANFNPAPDVTLSFTVAKAGQTITFGTPANQTFSPTSTVALSASSNSGLAVSFSSQTTGVCTVSGAAVTMVSSGNCTIRASQAGNANYLAATDVDRSFTISRASQSITFATLADRAYSRTTFTVSATTSASGLSVGFASQTTGVCTTSGTNGTTVTMVSLGTCTLRASQAGDGRYLAALDVDRSFTISRASQTVSFSMSLVPAQTYGNQTFTVSGSATGTDSAGAALAVSFSSSTPGVCSTSGSNGSTVSIVAAGTCSIVAAQDGNNLFSAASPVTQSITIARKTVTAPNAAVASRAYNGGRATGSITVGSLSGVVGSETLGVTASGTDYSSPNVGSHSTVVTYTLSNGANGGLASNYQISTATLTGQITRRPLTITAVSVSKTADEATPTFAVTQSGLVSGETVSAATYTFVGTGSTSYASSTTPPTASRVGAYSLTPSAVVLTSPASASNYEVTYVAGNYSISHGAAKKLTVPTFSGSRVSGEPFGIQPEVTIRDDGDNVITTGAMSTATVTATITAGTGGELVGTRTASAVDGVARFTTLGLAGRVTSTYTVTYSIGGLTSAAQSMAVTPGSPTKLAITNTVSARVATVFSTQPQVEIQDAQGNRVTTSTARVSATVSGATLSGTTTISATSGRADFTDLSMVGTTGTPYALTFSSAGLSQDAQDVTLQAGPAARLVLSTRAAGTRAGLDFSTAPAVTVQDAGGNAVATAGTSVTATVTQVDGRGELLVNGASPAVSKTALTNSSGVATFTGLGISGLNGITYRITYSATVASVVLSTAIQDVTVTTGPATQIEIDRTASGAASGAAMSVQPRVRILDRGGNVVTAGADQVTVNASVDAGSLTNSSATTVDGFATFENLTLAGVAGTRTLSFGSGSLSSASQSLTLVAGVPVALQVERQAAGAVAGTAFTTQPRVDVVDAQGNRVLTSSITVTASLATGPRDLTGAVAATAVNGRATFQNLGLNGTVGSFDLRFDGGSLPRVTHAALSLVHGVPSRLVIERSASGARAGSTFETQPIVELQDAFGNVITSGTQAASYVTASVSTGASMVGTERQQLSAGRVTFSGLGISGRDGTNYTLTFTSTTVTGVANAFSTATQSITGGVGQASSLVLTQSAVGTGSGEEFTTQPSVTIRDSFGNTVTSSTATVRARITSGVGGALRVNGTTEASPSRAAASGVATFTNLGIAGTSGTSYTVTYDIADNSSLAPVSQVIRVTPGSPSALVITRQPSTTASAGTALVRQPEVKIVDAQGNTVTSSTAVVTASRATGPGSLAGTAAVNAVSGVASYSGLSLRGTTGTYTVSFSMTTANGTISVTSDAVTVTHGAPNKVVVTNKLSVAAGSAASAAAFGVQPRAVVQDAWGNTIIAGTAASAAVTVSASDGATLNVGGSTTVVDGERRFSGVGVRARTGTYTITYSATVDGVALAADSHTVTVTHGAAASVSLVRPAGGTASGATFTTQPQVRVLDSAGNVVGSSSAQITATVSPSASGALTGTTSSTASSGVATFTDLGITGTAGVSYTVSYSTTLASSTSVSTVQTVVVTPGAVSNARSGLSQSVAATGVATGSVRSGVAFTTQPTVTLRDAQDNVVTSASDEITLTVARKTGTSGDLPGQLNGDTSVNALQGVATFSGISLSGTAGVTYTLSFTRNSTVLATQDVAVLAGNPVRLNLNTAGAGARAGLALTTQPIVGLRDAAGNAATTSGVLVSAAVSAGGTLTNVSATTNAGGIATFTGLTLAGRTSTYTVTFTSGSLGSATQTLALAAGNAHRIDVDPAVENIVAASGTPFDLGGGIRIVDSSGNTVSTGSTNVGVTTNPSMTSVNGTSLGSASLTQRIRMMNSTTSRSLSGVEFTTNECGSGTASNIDWSGASALFTVTSTCRADHFTVYYSGTIVSPETGDVTFYSNTDDGFLMRIGGVNVIDNWRDQGPQPWPSFNGTGTIRLEAGRVYDFKAWFYEHEGGEVATLRWKLPSVANAASAVVVPASAFSQSLTVGSTGGAVPITRFDGAAGDYTVTYSASGLLSDSQNVKLGAGSASRLDVATAPVGSRAGEAFVVQPEVAVRDSVGNLVVGNSSTVRSYIVSKPSGSPTLVGTPGVTAVDGVARNSNLGIAGPAGAYRVGVSSAVQNSDLLLHLDAGLSYPGSGTTWTDLSGNNKNAAFSAAPTHTAPTTSAQASLAFGSSVHGSVSNFDFGNFSNGLTIQATVDFAAAESFERIIDFGNGQASNNILLTRDGTTNDLKLDFYRGSDWAGACVATGVISSGFQNYALVLSQSQPNDPLSCVVYKNGQLWDADSDGSTTDDTAWLGTAPTQWPNAVVRTSNLIGKSNWANAPFAGGMRNLLIYKAALSQTAVVANAIDNDYYDINVTAGDPTQVSTVDDSNVSTAAAGANSGAAFASQPTVRIRDASGNVVTSASGTVTAELVSDVPGETCAATSGARLSGTTTVSLTSGVATFSTLALTGATGTYCIAYTSGSLVRATQTISLAPGAPARLSLSVGGANVAAGTEAGSLFTTMPKVAVLDAQGNLVTSSSAAIRMELTTIDNDGSSTGELMGDDANNAKTVNATSGVAEFTGTGIIGVDGLVYTVTYSTTGLTPVSQDITVTTGPAAKLVVTRAAASARAGLTLGTLPTVELRDAGDNVVDDDTTVIRATLSTAVQGATGSLSSNTATLTNGIASFSGTAFSGTAGVSGTAYTVTYAAMNGAQVNSNIAAAMHSLTARPGLASGLSVSRTIGSEKSGSAFANQPTVSLVDTSNNPVDGVAALVTAAIDCPSNSGACASATLLGDVTKPLVEGQAVFTDLGISAEAGSSYTVTYSATIEGTERTATGSIPLVGGDPARMDLTAATGNVVGATFSRQPTVSFFDAFGNAATVPSGTKVRAAIDTITINGASTGAFSGTTDVTVTAGQAAFTNLAPRGVAGQRYRITYTALDAADGELPQFTPLEQSLTLAAGAPATMTFATDPGGATAGSTLLSQPIVELRDAGGNLANTGTVSVSLTSGPAGVNLANALTGTATVATNGGAATFSGLALAGTAGDYVFTFTPSGGVAAQTKTVTLAPGAASKLVLATSAVAGVTGTGFTTQPVVQITDAHDNVITSESAVISAAITAGANGSLVGSTRWAATAGQVAFTDLGIAGRTSESYAVTFSATVGGSTFTVVQSNIAVQSGPATSIGLDPAVTGASSNGLQVAQSGRAFADHSGGSAPIVTFYDAGGNIVTGSTAGVTASVSVGGSLVGTTSASPANGAATFSTLGLSGLDGTSYTVTFETPGLPSVAQQFVAAPGAAARLSNDRLVVGASFGTAAQTSPRIRLRDSAGNPVATSGTPVTVRVSTGGTVSGTTSANTVDGVATFDGLIVSGTMGTQFTLTFEAAGLTSVTQDVVVVLGPAARVGFVTSPTGTASGAAFTTQPSLVVQDLGGNTVSSSNATITASVAQVGGTGSLVGTTSATAVGGIATFSDLGITGTDGTTYTISFGGTNLTAATTTVSVTTGAPSQLIVTNSSVPAAESGLPFGSAVVVRVADTGGNTVVSSTADVTASISGGGGAQLFGTRTIAAVGGSATFTDLGVSGTAGAQPTISFAASGMTSATLVPTVSAGPAARVSLTGYQSQSAPSGAAFAEDAIVRIEDTGGNLITSGDAATADVTATITTVSVGGVATGELVGATTVRAVGGVATFGDLGITGVAGRAYNVTYSSTVGLTTLTSVSEQFTVSTGPAVALELTTLSRGTASGAAFSTQPVLAVRDSGGNLVTNQAGTVRATVASGASLEGTVSKALVDGIADFDGTGLGITGAAGTTYVVTYTVRNGSNAAIAGIAAATQSIEVSVGAPKSLALTQPALHSAQIPARSGTAFATQPVVTVKDSGGNTVTASTAEVVASVAQVTVDGSPTGSLAGSTMINAVDGVARFANLTLSGRTTAAYVVTYTAASLPNGTNSVSQLITPQSGDGSSLRVATPASIAAAGAVLGVQPVVEVLDAAGNRAATSSARISVSTSGGTLTGPTFVDAVDGVATFSGLGLTGTAGVSYTLTFEASGLSSASHSVTASVGAPTRVVLTTQSAGTTAGTQFVTQPTVQLRDAGDNHVTVGAGSSLTVTAGVTRINVGGTETGEMIGATTAVASGGTASFETLGFGGRANVAYTISYGATFNGTELTPATQTVVPTPGEPTVASIQVGAAGAVVGQSFSTQPRISVLDRFGNTVTAGSSLVNASISSGATLIGTTSRSTSNGVAVFTNLGARGTSGQTYTLSFGLAGYDAVTQTIDLMAGSPSRVMVSRASQGATAGAVLSTTPVIQITDIDGNRVTNSSAVVTASITQVDGQGTLVGGNATAVNGTASFPNLAVTGRAGTAYTITYESLGLLPAREIVQVGLGTPSSLELLTRSVGTAAGQPFTQQPRVVVKDPGGNVVTTSSAVISASVAPVAGGTGGSLVGTTAVSAVEGVATFSNLGLTGTNGVEYRISYSMNGVPAAAQDLTATVGSASSLVLTRQSVGNTNGARFATQPRVTIRDAGGNTVTSFNSPVTASVSGNGGLLGTTAVNAINGVATFTDLGIDGTVGTTYVVTYSVDGLVAATQSIDLAAALPGVVPQFGTPQSTTDGFEVAITNHDAAYTYTGTATSGGRVTVSSSGVVTVSGLGADTVSTLTLTSIRAGYTTETASVVSRSNPGPALVPVLATPVATASGFTVQISNFNTAFIWRATASAGGTATVSSRGLVSVTGLGGGVVSTVTVTTSRFAHAPGSTTSSSVSTLLSGVTPTFTTPTRTDGGFTVRVTNYDPTYSWDTTVTSGGTVTMDNTGLITVTGLDDGTRAGVLVVTSRSGHTSRSATAEGQSLSPALVPSLGEPTPTATGWTVAIANYDAVYSWSASVSQGNASLNNSTGVVTVTGVTTSGTLTVATTRAGHLAGSASTTVSVESGLTPLFASATATGGTYSVAVANHSSDYTWQVTTTVGTASITANGQITVTAASAPTITVTAARRGYSTQQAQFAFGLSAAPVPTFGAVTATTDGFTVPVTNHDADYTWTASATAGAFATINSSGTVTVTGLPSGTTATVTVFANRSGRATGSAQVEGTSTPLAARVPVFGTPVGTADGFTVPVSNHDANWIWQVSATAGSAEIDRSGVVRVSGVLPGQLSTLTVRSVRARYADGTDTVAGRALDGGGLLAVFSAHVATADGYTVRVSNYDPDFTWTVSTPSPGSAVISNTGLVTVSGLSAGSTAVVTVETQRDGRATVSTTFRGGALLDDGVTPTLLNGYTPLFGVPVRTPSGFTVEITNYSSNWAWTAVSSRGATASVSSAGVLSVIGLGANVTDSVVVRTSRSATSTTAGYATGAATVTGTSLAAGSRAENLLTDVNLSAICPHGSPDREGISGANDLSIATKFSCYTAADRAIAPYSANSIGFSTPDLGNFIVTGVRFTAASDMPSRDPMTYTLWGCVRANQFCSVIVSNDLTGLTQSGAPISRGTDSTRSIRNSRAFNFYRLAFGSVRENANMIQVGEVQILGESGLPNGLTPLFRTPDTAATGFTVEVSNFSPLYAWNVSVPSPGRAAISDTGLIRVSNLSPQTPTTLTVTTSRGGFADGSATVSATTTSGPALSPVISTVVPTASGLTAVIENFDPVNYEWSAESTVNGQTAGAGTATISSTGAVTVSGATSGETVRLTVTTTRTNYLTGSSFVEEDVLRDGGALVFGTPTQTADGFTVAISGYNLFPEWDFAATVNRGATVVLNETTGVIRVSNLGAGVSATVTAQRTRGGYKPEIESVTGSAISPARVPVFGTTVLTDTTISVNVTNFDPAWSWAVSSSTGSATISSTGAVTVTHTPGATPIVTVTTSRSGHLDGEASISRQTSAPRVPVFGAVTPSGAGFTVDISNFDANWAWTARVEPLGSVSINPSSGRVTVTNTAVGMETTLTVTSTRTAHGTGTASVTHTRTALAGVLPAFASPTPLVEAFTAQISNFDPLFTWTAQATGGASATVLPTGVVNVAGASAAVPTTVTVTASRSGYTTRSATFTGLARPNVARIPMFGGVSPTADGFTAQITNFDAEWDWTASVDQNARVTISSTGQVTVTGAPRFTLVSVTVTSSRAGYNSGVAIVRATTVVAEPLVPRLGISTSNSTGFSVPIRNFDARWTWTVSAGSGVSGTVDNDGVVRVTGVTPGAEATITVINRRDGFVSGATEFTAVASPVQVASLTPKSVTRAARASNSATLTTSANHGLTIGDQAIISGVGTGFNGGIQVTSVPTPTTFTYVSIGNDVSEFALDPVGFAQPVSDVVMEVEFSPVGADSPTEAVVNVPFTAAEDGTVFESVASMTEEYSAGYGLVSVTATSADGADITRLGAAIRILFQPPAPDAVPVSSSDDGLTWTVLQLLATPELPATMDDGYYVNPDGTVWIFSRHLSMFGLLADQEVPLLLSSSETTLRPGDNAQVTLVGGVGTGATSVVSTTTSVCSIDANLVVTAIADGTCTLRATKDSSGRYVRATTTLDITVRTPPPPPAAPRDSAGNVPSDRAVGGGTPSNDLAPLPISQPNMPEPSAGAVTGDESTADAERPTESPSPQWSPPRVSRTRPAAATESRRVIVVSVNENAPGNGLVVRGKNFTVEFGGVDKEGRALAADRFSRPRVEPGQGVRMIGEGFAPSSRVSVWLFDGERSVSIGRSMTDANGAFDETFFVPASSELGEYTVELRGVTTDGRERSVYVSVVVVERAVFVTAPREPAGAVSDGSSGSWGFVPVLLVLMMIAAALAAAQIRRRRVFGSTLD